MLNRIWVLLVACSLVLARRQEAAKPPERPPLDYMCLKRDMEASGTKWSSLPDASTCALHLERLKAKNEARVRNGTGMVFFLHQHKSGGTTLCQIAKQFMQVDLTKFKGGSWDTNCVPFEMFAAHKRRQQPINEKTVGVWGGAACWIQETNVNNQKFLNGYFPGRRFIASEGALPDLTYLGANYTRVTMFREPMDRVLSSYHWWLYMKSQWGETALINLCQAYRPPYNATFSEWLDAYPDNWITRSFLGRSYIYSMSPITTGDFKRAVNRLHYFNAVLILEHFDDSMAILKHKFGWGDMDPGQERAGSQRGSSALSELQDKPELMMKLQRKIGWDNLLYQEALDVFKAQLREIKEGPRFNFTELAELGGQGEGYTKGLADRIFAKFKSLLVGELEGAALNGTLDKEPKAPLETPKRLAQKLMSRKFNRDARAGAKGRPRGRETEADEMALAQTEIES